MNRSRVLDWDVWESLYFDEKESSTEIKFGEFGVQRPLNGMKTRKASRPGRIEKKNATKYGSKTRPNTLGIANNPVLPEKINREIKIIKEKRRQKQLEQRQELILQHETKEKRITQKRLRETSLILLSIIIAAMFFGFVLYRQSQIATINYKNNQMQKNILLLEQQTSQIQEKLMLDTDFQDIRLEAMDQLGMQIPSLNQIIVLEMPKSDRWVTDDSVVLASVGTDSLLKSKQLIAEYFLTQS